MSRNPNRLTPRASHVSVTPSKKTIFGYEFRSIAFYLAAMAVLIAGSGASAAELSKEEAHKLLALMGDTNIIIVGVVNARRTHQRPFVLWGRV